MMTQALNKTLKRSSLLRYWSIGGLATGLHYSVFVVLLFVMTPVWATLIGGCIGAVFSYLANKRMTFIQDQQKTLNPIRFYIVTIAYNVGNVGMMYAAQQLFSMETTFYWVCIQLVITVVLSVVSYLIHKYWSYHYAE